MRLISSGFGVEDIRMNWTFKIGKVRGHLVNLALHQRHDTVTVWGTEMEC